MASWRISPWDMDTQFSATMGCWKIVNQYLDPGMASWGLTCPTNSKRRQAQSRGTLLQFAMENHQF